MPIGAKGDRASFDIVLIVLFDVSLTNVLHFALVESSETSKVCGKPNSCEQSGFHQRQAISSDYQAKCLTLKK